MNCHLERNLPDNDESVNETSSKSEKESDEEMEIQDWRRQRFFRESYLESIRVTLGFCGGYIYIYIYITITLLLLLQNDDADFSEFLITLQGGASIKITERKQGA